MIKLEIAGCPVAMVKFFADADKAAALEYVAAYPGASVVCLDTPPTSVFVEFVTELHVTGRRVIVRDHHDVTGEPRSPRDSEIRAAADAVRALLGADAVISDRQANPACSSLVHLGEFDDQEFILIVDADMDGLTAACKALGVTYAELDADAALLDGPPTRRQGLSPLGDLLNKAGATLPPFNDRGYEVAAAALWGSWVKAVSGDTAACAELDLKVERFDQMVARAKAIAATATEVAPGVWLADVGGQRGYHMATLAAELEARPDCRITVIRKDDGPIAAKHGGGQYSLARHSADKESDLKSLLPGGFTSSPEMGMIGNVPFLIHVSQEVWGSVVLPALWRGFCRICGKGVDGANCAMCGASG